MFSPLDHHFMARALELAELGRYTTQPNPRVGCVIANSERLVGEGWHRKKGEAHAEPLALAAAGEQARGATAYVTLEPHCFHGRTPPCTDALIKAGVRRVVCAMADPHPRVAGAGIEQLQAAGIQVDVGLLEQSAIALNRGFVKRHREGLPFVTVKLASSVDGRTALANGASQWITGPEARADVQRLRAASCAIVTGIGTVSSDDPSLTVRDPGIDTLGRQPVRVVLDTSLRLSPHAKLLQQPGQTIVVHAQDHDRSALTGAGAELWRAPTRDGLIDIEAMLRELARRECNEVLIEAGPTLAGSVLAGAWADELLLYLAPMWLGDAARPLAQFPPLTQLDDAYRFRWVETRRVGSDLRLRLAPDKSKS
ncbi:MAG: bifunctional diaminohydroxyphosphoribosylaminopyrimidine deaminase/5-amino-6-(5-phosphoribosylamino)uracil reductase RibD [Steroidobacteraceae bacterium]